MVKILRSMLICLFTPLVFFSEMGYAQQAQPVFPIRAWVLLDYNMTYLRKMIPLAAREGITHVQLCHKIGMQLSDYLEPQRNRDLRELIALAHQHGVKAYVWTHELDHVPQQFMEGGMIIADGAAFWQWMGDRYRTLMNALPDVDGVVITLTETKVPIDDDNLVISPLSPAERFRKMSQTIYDVLKPLNKQLILRTFTWIKEDYDWMLTAFRELPEDIIIMSKVNWGDWFQHYPSNPFIGKVAPHPQIVEYDLAGQYHGDILLPWVYAEFIQEQMQYGLKQNTAGVIGRVDWSGHAFGSANEFNVIAFDALARDPYLDLDDLWLKWAGVKFGKEASPRVISALKRTNEIANLTFFTLGFKIFKQSGSLTNLSYMDGTRIMHALFCRDVQARWKPELIATAEKLLQPTAAVMQEAIDEKEKAIFKIDSCIADIEAAQPFLSSSDYTYLSTLFNRQKLHARSWRWITEAYFRYLFYTSSDPGQKNALVASLEKIEEMAEVVQNCFADRIYFLRPERMHAFVNDIRILTSDAVKWFAATNNESGRVPLLYDLNDDGQQEVIVNACDNRVYAFQSGREAVWHFDSFGLRVWYPNISDPVSYDVDADGQDELLIGAADGHLYVFGSNGALKWKYKTKNSIIAAPCIITPAESQPVTVCASLDGHLYGLSPQGALLWQIHTASAIRKNPVITADETAVIFGTDNGKVMKVNKSGEISWTTRLSGSLSGAPASHLFNNQEIYSFGCGNSLYLYNNDGNRIQTLTLKDKGAQICVAAKTVLVDKKQLLVVGTEKGTLWAVDAEGRDQFIVNLGGQIRTAVEPVTIMHKTGMLVGVDNTIVFIDGEGKEIKRFTAANDAKIGTGLLLNDKKDEILFTGMDRKLYVIDMNYFQ